MVNTANIHLHQGFIHMPLPYLWPFDTSQQVKSVVSKYWHKQNRPDQQSSGYHAMITYCIMLHTS